MKIFYTVLLPLLLIAKASTAQVETVLKAHDAGYYHNFGVSVAIDGDWALVGADDDPDQGYGAAYFFQRQGYTWVQRQKVQPADVTPWDRFGSSLAIYGDFAIIGSPDDDDDGIWSGSAYVYQLVDGQWTETQKLHASDAQARYSFGASVSMDGDYLVVSRDRPSPMFPGAAYVFHNDGDQWNQVAILEASDGELYDHFGYSSSISGSRVVIGAPADSLGSVYIFRQGEGTWVEEAKLTADDPPDLQNNFGNAVALSDSALLVADSQTWNLGHQAGTGKAYIFELVGNEWVQQQILGSEDLELGDSFGESVALEGNIAVIGAKRDDDLGLNSGSVYVFERNGQEWVEAWKLLPHDLGEYDVFGASVGISNFDVIGGSWGHDGPVLNAGAAFIFDICLDPTITLTIEPLNPPIIIPPQGGMFSYSYELANNLDIPIRLDVWVELRPRDHGRLVISRDAFWFDAGGVYTGAAEQLVPLGLPFGTWTYAVRVGIYPNTVAAYDVFNFVKTPAWNAGERVDDYSLSGLDFQQDNMYDSVNDREEPVRAEMCPPAFRVDQIGPDPFNISTTVAVALPETSELRVDVFNTAGRRVAVLAAGTYAAGYHHFIFNGGDFSSGIYFIRATVPGKLNEMRKVVLVK